MNTQQQRELVKEWGFSKVAGGTGLFERVIYSDQGYTEFWEEHKPEVIQFYKQGEGHTHDYKIDWKLFDKKGK